MSQLPYFLLVLAFLILGGACSSKLSSWLNVPVLLVFLGVGMLAGEDGIGHIRFEDARAANVIGSIALAFILFAGGYDTRWKAVKNVLLPGGLLASLGVLLTAGTVGVFAAWVLNAPLAWGLLLGSIISSTDAAAVFSILRSRSVALKGELQPLLELESGSNDPMAAFLTLFMIGVVQSGGEAAYWTILPQFLIKMSLGVGFGVLWGMIAVWLFNKIDLEYDGLYYVLGVGFVLLAFAGTEALWGNGFMSVYVCGLYMGNSKFIFQHGLGRFHDGIGWLMQVMLFATLGLLVTPHALPGVAWRGIIIAVFMMLAARPLAVFLCLIGSRFDFRQKVLISWVGLRGGAPIMLATFPLLYQVKDARLMFNIVFFIVLISVLTQGKTLMLIARLLKLASPLKLHPRVPLEFENTGTLNGDMREFEIYENAPCRDKTIAQLGLPTGALVLLIRRGHEFVVPHGSTRVLAHDGLMILADPVVLAAAEPILAGDGDGELS